MNTEQTEDHTAGLELKPRCGTFAQIMMGGQRKSVNPNLYGRYDIRSY